MPSYGCCHLPRYLMTEAGEAIFWRGCSPEASEPHIRQDCATHTNRTCALFRMKQAEVVLSGPGSVSFRSSRHVSPQSVETYLQLLTISDRSRVSRRACTKTGHNPTPQKITMSKPACKKKYSSQPTQHGHSRALGQQAKDMAVSLAVLINKKTQKI